MKPLSLQKPFKKVFEGYLGFSPSPNPETGQLEGKILLDGETLNYYAQEYYLRNAGKKTRLTFEFIGDNPESYELDGSPRDSREQFIVHGSLAGEPCQCEKCIQMREKLGLNEKGEFPSSPPREEERK